MKKILVISFMLLVSSITYAACPYDINCINNPYGAGNPYKHDGLMNPYSRYGSPYSNESWTNPYATNPPKVYDKQGNNVGTFSTNPYDYKSILNPNSINKHKINPYKELYIVPNIGK